MRLEARKYLSDIKQAVILLGTGKEFSDYRENPIPRAAVECTVEIIGEAHRSSPRSIQR
jgi:uncharacterized protein with HEPN domain